MSRLPALPRALRLPWLGPRAQRALLIVLLACKLLLTAHNAWTFDGEVYDQPHHEWRARSGGLEVGKMAYNPPLYYLPALAGTKLFGWSEGRAGDADRLGLLRATNVAWLALFYLVWIFGLFPRLAADRTNAFLASLLLLVLPGYQRLAAMIHPDLALAALSSVALLAFFAFRAAKPVTRAGEAASLLGLAFAIGAVGLTRPFAIVPVFVLWAATMWLLARRHAPLSVGFLGRAAAVSLVICVVSGAWHVYRITAANVVLDAYDDKYMAKFVPHQKSFRFAPYFLSFRGEALWDAPNRDIAKLDRVGPWYRNRNANSFFTTAYSELWGDHWLYFSGARGKETELWEKRRMGLAAFPVTLAWIGQLLVALALLAWRARREAFEAQQELVAAALLLGGVAVFLWWQTGPALLPGKNSTIKFIYNAHLVPLAIALAFSQRLPRAATNGWTAALFALALLGWPLSSWEPLTVAQPVPAVAPATTPTDDGDPGDRDAG